MRTETASLHSISITSNPLLLWGMAFEVAFSLALVYIPPLASIFALAAPPPTQLMILLTYPPIVWAIDELHKDARRRQASTQAATAVKFALPHRKHT